MRLTAFPSDEAAAPETLHWERGVGALPETTNRQPALPRVIEEGAWNNCRLQADSQRGQIHWRAFSATPNPNGQVIIGPFPSAISPFHALMRRWLDGHCPPVNRIAFGANVVFQVDSLQEAYTRLDGMLPNVSVASDSSRDFMYRINRRRKAQSIDGFEINRLAIWSVVEGMEFEVIIVAGVPSTRATNAKLFCRLELDINTVPIAEREIPREALLAVFDELVEAATEIANRGDIP